MTSFRDKNRRTNGLTIVRAGTEDNVMAVVRKTQD